MINFLTLTSFFSCQVYVQCMYTYNLYYLPSEVQSVQCPCLLALPILIRHQRFRVTDLEEIIVRSASTDPDLTESNSFSMSESNGAARCEDFTTLCLWHLSSFIFDIYHRPAFCEHSTSTSSFLNCSRWQTLCWATIVRRWNQCVATNKPVFASAASGEKLQMNRRNHLFQSNWMRHMCQGIFLELVAQDQWSRMTWNHHPSYQI